MDTPLLFVILAAYFTIVIMCAKRGTLQMELDIYGKIRHAKGVFQRLEGKKNGLNEEREALQNEALEIFTLYEITSVRHMLNFSVNPLSCAKLTIFPRIDSMAIFSCLMFTSTRFACSL